MVRARVRARVRVRVNRVSTSNPNPNHAHGCVHACSYMHGVRMVSACLEVDTLGTAARERNVEDLGERRHDGRGVDATRDEVLVRVRMGRSGLGEG